MNFKQRIKDCHLDRKVLANRLKISYAGLTARLNNFQRFSAWEEKTLENILTECEAVQREVAARLDAREVSPYAR